MAKYVDDPILRWLLEGDPAIRWQTSRDLLDAPRRTWEVQRREVEASGWGARLLENQDAQGTWGRSLYGKPKWTCTTYTLLLLRDMGLPQDCAKAKRGARVLLDRGIQPGTGAAGKSRMDASLSSNDTCVVGMWLTLGAYFNVQDGKLAAITEYLLAEQMTDGGWNCRKKRGATHSSLHTTLNVLDGVHEAVARGIGSKPRLKAAESRAIEFMLMHRMFRSDKTGQVIKPAFTKFSFPPRYHYDVLRGLEYLRVAGALDDNRLNDAYELLDQRRGSDGKWPLQNKHPGKVYFDMEPVGSPSRWNTLRALRCLRHR